MTRLRITRIGMVACALLACSPALAQQVTRGNIFEVLGDTGARTGSTVDHWGFTVNTAGEITIDTLSWETDSDDRLDMDNDFSEVYDVNDDGEIAYIDVYIYLFEDDGSLDVADLVASNDDDFANTYSDGSIYGYDSYLRETLNAGDYILALGAFSLDVNEAVAGENDETSYPISGSGFDSPINVAAGDYQITWTGDLTITSDPGTAIPEPAALAIALLTAALAACRRRR